MTDAERPVTNYQQEHEAPRKPGPSDDGPKSPRRESSGARRFGYLVAVVVNLIMMQVANRLLDWGVPFLTPQFNAALWAINLSLGAHVLANAVWFIYDPRWFRRLLQIGLNVLAFVSVFVLYSIFPFEFERLIWETTTRIVLVVTMFGIAVGSVVEFIGLVTGREN
jgi:hypothetical protein